MSMGLDRLTACSFNCCCRERVALDAKKQTSHKQKQMRQERKNQKQNQQWKNQKQKNQNQQQQSVIKWRVTPASTVLTAESFIGGPIAHWITHWHREREVPRSRSVGGYALQAAISAVYCRLSVLLVFKTYVFCHLCYCELFNCHNM